MKKITRIAKIELSTLFYSPIAWLLLIVFFVQCAMSYVEYMQSFVTFQELGGDYKQQLVFLTEKILAYPMGMSPQIAMNLYLYLPLLTMGLISREISSGTIKLLYSSPIKTRDIVLGKYLSMVVYSLLLTIISGIFFMTVAFQLENPDTGLILSIMLGIFILLSTYGAIGLFVSSLTSYQVVAAISTFVLFAFLAYIGTVWQDIDFVRDLTYSLSIAGRINNMGSGLITTKDLFYFIAIIYIFVGLTILKLQAGRSTDSRVVKTLKYVSLVISGLVIGFISSRPTLIGYLDTTATKTRTLTKTSQNILKTMKDGELEITSYINLLDDKFWYGLPNQRNIDLERWLPYIRFKPDIKMNYVYYYDSVQNPYYYKQYPGKTLDQIADTYFKSFRISKGLFKKPAEIRKMIDLRPEENRYVMHLKYNGKSTYLRLFDDPLVFPTEREVGAALKRLTVKLPKVAFLEGELERSPYRAGDKDYKQMASLISFRYALINQGFDFTTVSLKTGDIPADVSALVIADPKAAIDSTVMNKIQQFIDNGGNLMIAGEPGKQLVLNPLLDKFNIKVTDGMIVQKSEDFAPNLTFNFLTPTAGGFSKSMGKVLRDSMYVSMPSVTALQYDSSKFSVHPLLMTDERKSWRRIKPIDADSLHASFSAADGDENGKFPLMLALTRKMPNGKEQHIIISADADFMSNSELSRYDDHLANFSYNTALFGWLSNGDFPVDVSRPDSLDQKIFLEGSTVPILRIIYVWIIPFILFLLGTILLVRRKKQ